MTTSLILYMIIAVYQNSHVQCMSVRPPKNSLGSMFTYIFRTQSGFKFKWLLKMCSFWGRPKGHSALWKTLSKNLAWWEIKAYLRFGKIEESEMPAVTKNWTKSPVLWLPLSYNRQPSSICTTQVAPKLTLHICQSCSWKYKLVWCYEMKWEISIILNHQLCVFQVHHLGQHTILWGNMPPCRSPMSDTFVPL